MKWANIRQDTTQYGTIRQCKIETIIWHKTRYDKATQYKTRSCNIRRGKASQSNTMHANVRHDNLIQHKTTQHITMHANTIQYKKT